MKSLIIIVLITVLFGCDRTDNTKVVLDNQNRPIEIKAGREKFDCYEWEHKGHKYLIINRPHGSGITHAGHCGCGNRIDTRTGGDSME